MHRLLSFANKTLLQSALTHRSYVNENPNTAQDNERLEFLGDAILTFLSGDYLYRLHPELGEDKMTRRRSALVDEQQLAKFAIEVGLHLKMRLGQGAIQEGGCQNSNLLSSTFEAVIGAYYLDKNRDIEAIRPIVEELFDAVPQDVVVVRSNIDFKNQFQEWVHANLGPTPPRYGAKQVGGVAHAPEFIAQVFVGDMLYGEGKGRSKKEAEKRAAENALSRLKPV
jgi:ribonuclease III